MFGGYSSLVDPRLDARSAEPIWQPDPPTTVRLIPLRNFVGSGIKLYQLVENAEPRGVHDSAGLYCTTKVGSQTWRLHLANGLSSEDNVAFVVAPDALMRRRMAAAGYLVSLASRKRQPGGSGSAPVARSGQVHKAILQTIDGATNGASQREIAAAVYGKRWVAEHWSPDSELRARIRYFLRRGQSLVHGDYRRLAYL